MGEMKSRFYIWLAARMPKILVYYCANQLGASVTTHEYANKCVGEISYLDMIGTYLNRYNSGKQKPVRRRVLP